MANTQRLAKLTRPNAKGLVKRERLFAQLDAAERQRVVWIGAPAGSGKTSLISSYLDARKLKEIWYQVDNGDTDIASFFYYLGLAVSTATPRRSPFSLLLTPEYLPNFSFFLRRFFRELFQRAPQPSALVFDNFQEAETPQLVETVNVLCEEVPEGCKVFIISRNAPPAPLTHHIANESIATLNADDLKSQISETRAMLPSSMGDELVEVIQEKSDGWTAGVILIREHIRRTGVEALNLSTTTPASIFDYFAGQILTRLDEDSRNFLLLTSLFPQMTAVMASQVTGEVDAQDRLEFLYRQHVFTDRRDGDEPTYQYHPLFSTFLRTRLKETRQHGEWTELATRSASLLESAGMIDEAAELFQQAQAWQPFIRLTLENAERTLAQGRHQTLATKIKAIPEELRVQIPWLQVWLGMAQLVSDPLESRRTLIATYNAFVSAKEIPGQFASVSAIIETYRIAWAEFISADPWIAKLDELWLAHEDKVPQPMQAQALMALSVVVFRPTYPRLIDLLAARSWVALSQSSNSRNAILIAQGLLQYCLCKGDIIAGNIVVEHVAQKVDLESVDPIHAIGWYTTKINYDAALLADFDSANASFVTAEKLVQSSGVIVLNSLLYGNAAHAAIASGNLALATKLLQIMKGAVPPFQLLNVSFHHYLSAIVELHRNNPHEARDLASKALKISEQLGLELPSAFNALALACAQIELGNVDEATTYFDQILEVFRRGGSLQLEWVTLCLMLYADVKAGRSTSIQADLRKWLAIAREHGYLTNYPCLPKVQETVCALALEHDIEIQHVKRIIRANRLIPPSSDITNWSWPIKIRVLGKFSIELDDVPVEFGRKSPKKDLALLKLLVPGGGNSLAEAALKDELWPESDGDLASNNLKQSIHRLRTLLWNHQAIESKNGMVTLNGTQIWVDAWAFESFCKKENRLNGDASSLGQYGRRLVELYQGNVLVDGMDLPSLVSYRERLRGVFVESVTLASQHMEDVGDHGAALKLYREATEVDNYFEAFYQGQMRCMLQLSRHADGLAVFERLRQVMLSQWKTEPSRLSKNLAEELRRGSPN